MARGGSRSSRPASTPPPTFPDGPVQISTGTAHLETEPGDPWSVTLYVEGVPSSHLDLRDPTRLEFEYMQQMAAVVDRVAGPAEPLDVLHLGAAGCTLARYVAATRPRSRQFAVEVDERLAGLVRTWFDLPRSPTLRIRVGEARAVLATRPDASADVVVRDVFAGPKTPEHLCTVQFVAEVDRVLRPGGVYLANCADRPPLEHARAEVATTREVFAEVAVTAEPAQLRGRRYGNLVVIGTQRTGLLGSADLSRSVRALPAPTRILHGRDLADFVGSAVALRDPQPPPAGARTSEEPGTGGHQPRTH